MRLFLLILLSIFVLKVNAQSTYIPLNRDYYHLIDRYEILSGTLPKQFQSGVKPFERKSVAEFIDSVSIDSSMLSRADSFNLQYLKNDNWEWSSGAHKSKKPFLNNFYERPAAFYSVNTPDFTLQANPVIYFSYGRELKSGGINSRELFQNTRGVVVRGLISKKLGFYSLLTDNQAYFPNYVNTFIDYRLAVPGAGYTKPFKNHGYDWFFAQGYITFSPIKHIQIQFGHGKNFIGNGYRSLILSNFASNYTFLKINTHIWKINYENLYAELNADVFYLNKAMPKKYMAFHHLGINIGKHLNVGVFESIIFSRGDSGVGAYDINYLNPIIFYRSIEQQLGSEDNALLGADFKWNFLSHFSVYGQLVLDEFSIAHIKAWNGWWSNKQAGQLGFKYINVAGIKNLDLQMETNIIRPYTYSHKSKQTSYTHYNQSLAHPLGANLYEVLGILRYQPTGKVTMTGKIFHVVYGADSANTNWGNNILLPYTTHMQDYNNKIAQGYRTTINYISFNISYQIRHNMFIDFTSVFRIQHSALASLTKNDKFATVSLRWNIAKRLMEF